MTEKYLLCNTQVVQNILAGTQSQDRRPLKPQPREGRRCVHFDGARWYTRDADKPGSPIDKPDWKPPYSVGDLLYVRETFYVCMDGTIVYRADCDSGYIGWKPSIHMPKKYARIWLEVTGVRVEQVQSISEEDARAEGCDGNDLALGDDFGDPVVPFMRYWQSLYPGSWERNEWVSVTEFKRIERTVKP